MGTQSATPATAKDGGNIRLAVITAVCGSYPAQLRFQNVTGADFFYFCCGTNVTAHPQWRRVEHKYYQNRSKFMEAKYYKTQWHKIDILQPYSHVVWLDATVQMKRYPLLSNYITVYNHQHRRSTRAEARVSYKPIKTLPPDPRYELFQWGLVEMQGTVLPDIRWLAITCWIVLHRCKEVEHMNDVWWQHLLQHSPQDQVSFPLACTTANFKPLLLNDGVSHLETKHYKKWGHAGGKYYATTTRW